MYGVFSRTNYCRVEAAREVFYIWKSARGGRSFGGIYGKGRIFGVLGVDFFDFSKNSPFLEIGWFLRRDGGVVQHVRARGTAAKRRTAWPMSDQWKANVKQAKPRGRKKII